MIKTHIEALRDTNDLFRLALDRSEDERAKLRRALEAILAITDGRQPKDFPTVPMIANSALGGGK